MEDAELPDAVVVTVPVPVLEPDAGVVYPARVVESTAVVEATCTDPSARIEQRLSMTCGSSSNAVLDLEVVGRDERSQARLLHIRADVERAERGARG